MRLLQLATAPDELLDLHPNITVVTGLDDGRRRLLAETIVGLARGVAIGPPGLLEAHGILFDLAPDTLALVDAQGDGLRPVVGVTDLPTAGHDPRVQARTAAERALGEADERWTTAREEESRLATAAAVAEEAVERARRALEDAESGATGRLRSVDAITEDLDHAVERRRRLEEEIARLTAQVDAAAQRRAEVELETDGVRGRRLEAATRCSELAAQLDAARLARDPEAADELAAATAALEAVRADVEAERAAEQAAAEAAGSSTEDPGERLARVQQEIEDLEQRLAAFGPAEVDRVAEALATLRAADTGVLVPVPEALQLADTLAELEADLVATSGVGATPIDVATGRARLDSARQALLEAEQAVRNPELDRAAVNRLEDAHAELLDAMDKADSRFAGARAQRRVDALRAAERVVLDELGFASYAEYVMGSSLHHVDPEKEATLDAARVELTAAEDAWRLLEAETEAELARAERMERRRHLVEEGRRLLGRPVPTGSMVDALRDHRVEEDTTSEAVEDLRDALEAAGVAVGADDLAREDLALVADLWLAEADKAAAREQEARASLASLVEERVDALAAVEAAADRAAAGPSAEEDRSARVGAADERVSAAEARHRAAGEAEAAVAALTAELDAAATTEAEAAEAAASAEQAVADVVAAEAAVRAELEQRTAELDDAVRLEAEANEALREHDDTSSMTPAARAEALAAAEVALADARAEHAAATAAARALERERAEAIQVLGAMEEVPAADETPLAEEIEWYLLARLAAQRSVSLAGSVPLLLDDALAGLDAVALDHVLGRLERMAEAVQVIVVSDDPLVTSWAEMAGEERAAVVRPEPVSGP